MRNCYLATNSSALPWRKSDFAEGIHVKDLGVSDGQAMQLVRFDADTSFPWHKHSGPEFIFILSGEVVQNGRRLSEGWAGVASAGSEEDDFTSATGATFLIVYTE